MSETQIVVEDGRVGNISREKVKSLLEFVILLGNSLKEIIPGNVDNEVIDAIKYASSKKEIVEFISKIVDIISKVSPEEVEKLTQKIEELKAKYE